MLFKNNFTLDMQTKISIFLYGTVERGINEDREKMLHELENLHPFRGLCQTN